MFNEAQDDRTVCASRVRSEREVATLEYAIMLFPVSLGIAGSGDQIRGTVTGAFEQLMKRT